MEHYSLLWQIISIILGFASIISLGQLFYRTRNRAVLLFIISVFLIISRNIVFSLVRYGNISNFFILKRNLESIALGGLVYVLFIFISHFILLSAMHKLADRKIFIIDSALFILVSAFSIVLYIYLISNNWPEFLPNSWNELTVFSIIPVVIIKSIILYNGFKLSLQINQKTELKKKYYIILFYIAVGTAVFIDGLAYFMDPISIHLFSAYTVIIYPALLILLPLSIRELNAVNGNTIIDSRKIDDLCTKFDFDFQEKEIISLIVQGKSNKEIAWEQQTNLSKIKRKIFQIYKKCSINSRWELMSLLLN